MKKSNRTYICALAVTASLCAAETATADYISQEAVTMENIGTGPRAMGMGGAQIAAATDVSAILYNPAALARLTRVEAQFGLDVSNRQIDTKLISSKGTGSTSGSTNFSGLGTIGIAIPVKTAQGSLVFAAAYNRVKDFTGQLRLQGYSDADTADINNDTIWNDGIGVYSFAGAIDLSPTVSFGVSLDIWNGKYDWTTRQVLNDTSVGYSQLDIRGATDNITAVSVKPGFLYFTDNARLGAYARFPMTFHIDEDYFSEGYSNRYDGTYFQLYQSSISQSYNDPGATYTGEASYRIKAPMQLGFGVALGHSGGTMLAFDATYEDWKQANYSFDNSYFLNEYRSEVSWNAGIEQPLPGSNAVVRAGYMHSPVTFKGPRNNSSSSISVVNDRDYLTLGFGAKLDESFSIDAAYTHTFWSTEETSRTDEETRNTFFFGITYRGEIVNPR